MRVIVRGRISQKFNIINLKKTNIFNNLRLNYFSTCASTSTSNTIASSTMINKSLLKNNKDFSTKFRDSEEFHYLYNTNLLNIVNSMFLINKKFDNLVFMGNNPEIFLKKLPKSINIETFIYCDISESNLIESKSRIDSLSNDSSYTIPKNTYPILINQDKWPFKPNSIHCIINNLYLHNVESLEEHLRSIRESLIPDGCLLTNFFATSTLNELKFTLGVAEMEREGGISTNVLSFPHIADMGNLLHKLNFTLPSMNIIKYIYKFNTLTGLFELLEKIGESNFLKNKRAFKRKDTFIAAIALYQSLYNNKYLTSDQMFEDIRSINVDLREDKKSENYVYSTFEVGSMICWKYHASQQKPKERGSAEFSLKELATDVLEAGKDEIRYGTMKLKDKSEDEYEIIEMTEMIKEKIKNKLGEEIIKEKLKKLEEETNKEVK